MGALYQISSYTAFINSDPLFIANIADVLYMYLERNKSLGVFYYCPGLWPIIRNVPQNKVRVNLIQVVIFTEPHPDVARLDQEVILYVIMF